MAACYLPLNRQPVRTLMDVCGFITLAQCVPTQMDEFRDHENQKKTDFWLNVEQNPQNGLLAHSDIAAFPGLEVQS